MNKLPIALLMLIKETTQNDQINIKDQISIGPNGLFGISFFIFFIVVLTFGIGLLIKSGERTFKSSYNKLPQGKEY